MYASQDKMLAVGRRSVALEGTVPFLPPSSSRTTLVVFPPLDAIVPTAVSPIAERLHRLRGDLQRDIRASSGQSDGQAAKHAKQVSLPIPIPIPIPIPTRLCLAT